MAPVEGPGSNIPRDVQFRLDALRGLIGPDTGFAKLPGQLGGSLLDIAQRPGDFERMIGQEPNARATAARLLAGGIQQDVRFRNPLVRSLALGQAPTSANISAQEFAALPPDFRDALIGIIGEDQLPGFLFAVGQGTPTARGGVRQLAAGGVRV